MDARRFSEPFVMVLLLVMLFGTSYGLLVRQYTGNIVLANSGLHFTSHVLATYSDLEELKCLSKCSNDQNCRAFSYAENSTMKVCILYDTHHADTSLGMSYDGMRYYRLQSVCPRDNKHLLYMEENICYGIQFDNTYIWKDAQSICASAGGKLALVDSEEKWRMLYNLITMLNANNDRDGFYINGSDELVENTWLTTDGVDLSWIKWGAGQPNNIGSDQDCLEMKRIFNYSVNDHPCRVTRNRGFICQTTL